MKSTVLYHYYGPIRKNRCCRQLNTKQLAIASAVYTLNISILVVLLYSWQISVNTRKYQALGEVYYGIQISHFAIIATQLSMMVLSVLLFIGIYTENSGLVAPWIIGILTFMALEAVAMVYGNVLKDHIFGEFDSVSRIELVFFITRIAINALAIWSVMRFYHMLRSGVSWKINETIIEL